MEASTRERLTGALLLVVAVVIVAPEVLSGHHPAAQGTPLAQNPEDGAPLQTYDVQLDAARTVRPASAEAPEAAAQLAAVPPPVTRAAPPPVPAEPQAGAAPQPAVAVAAPAQSTPPATKAAASPPASSSTTPAAPPPVAAGRWWVQLGTFASRDNAQHLAQKLRAAGFAIEVSQVRVKGKELSRVRAGPVADRVAAGSLQDRLGQAGQKNSSLVPP
ncbi:MAG TPA: SPOR domain-containing protein [Steroidobacteraceae bacterium]|nr:SPOR domain-containing protein [Steroidobacteraceae bacterium]